MVRETFDLLYILIPTTKSRRERLDKCIASIKEHVKTPHAIVTYENSRGGFVPAIHDMLKGINGVVWAIGDDTIIETDGVDILWQKYHETYPKHDGVCQPDDCLLHGVVITMPMCHARILEKFTYKGYLHWGADAEFTDIMKANNKYTYVPEAVINHKHWVNGQATMDETYSKNNETNDADVELYKQRKKNGFTPLND